MLTVALLGSSCVVPPSCIGPTFGLATSRPEHFATLTLYAEPLEQPPEPQGGSGIGMWERFARGSTITVDGKGKMAVSGSGIWPESCPRAAPEDLGAAARTWRPVLDRTVTSHTDVLALASPPGDDDWRPDGPLLSLSFGAPSGKTVGLLWDGRSTLPPDLDTAVLETLEMVCSSSRRARKYLLRDLPPEVSGRLECR